MTDKTQPEALRLAEQYDYGDPATHGNAWKATVCTELRRQHALIGELSEKLMIAGTDLAGLRAENEALRTELRHQHARIAELEAQLEAVDAGAVQALSAAPAVPAGWVERWHGSGGKEFWEGWSILNAANREMIAHLGPDVDHDAVRDIVAAHNEALCGECAGTGGRWCPACAGATPPAEQQAAPKAAPGVGNSGFDHQTAADFLSGKTVSDESVRKFVQAARWAHDEKASLSAMLISVRGVLASREAEIALLKRALMEAEAAPQQEAQEPVALHQVYRCKIKSRKQIDKEIPRESQGWWADVAAGQKLLLRQAVQSDLDRCNLGGKRSKDPNDYMCETQTNGSLVSKVALEYMNPEQNVFASTALQPAPAPQADSQPARDDLPREDFAWLVVQEACETEPADEDDPECIQILRRDLKSAVLAAFLRQDAASAPADSVLEDAAFEAVRKKLCALPRYSFVLDDDGLVRRVQDRIGNWIEFDAAHELFDPVAVDAALAAQGDTP